jgi:predicted acyl esterase
VARPVSPVAAAPDRPWKRPGAARYAIEPLRGAPHATEVYLPDPAAVVVHHDVAVTTRDTTVLRVNVYLPPGDGPFPVLLCAHPYDKDNNPKKKRWGGGYWVPFQLRYAATVAPPTDVYRDLARPGGIREIGFLKIWSRGLRAVRLKYTLDEENSGRRTTAACRGRAVVVATQPPHWPVSRRVRTGAAD